MERFLSHVVGYVHFKLARLHYEGIYAECLKGDKCYVERYEPAYARSGALFNKVIYGVLAHQRIKNVYHRYAHVAEHKRYRRFLIAENIGEKALPYRKINLYVLFVILLPYCGITHCCRLLPASILLQARSVCALCAGKGRAWL